MWVFIVMKNMVLLEALEILYLWLRMMYIVMSKVVHNIPRQYSGTEDSIVRTEEKGQYIHDTFI
jgi:hypothetical protein